MEKFCVIGLMSGTSVDGLDVCFSYFLNHENKWSFEIKAAKTYVYPNKLHLKLKNATKLSGVELTELDFEFAKFCGKRTNDFIDEFQLKKSEIDFVSSHGHTVFHQPKKGITLQIGNGNTIAQTCGIKVINDFRTPNVLENGQGAPIVPIGDKLLFADYDACINLGGFSNISLTLNNNLIAFDICPVNIVLNNLAEKLGLKFDKGGAIAKSNEIDHKLLNKLNNLSFYSTSPPKSLGVEWVNDDIYPLFQNQSPEILIATFTEHAAQIISNVIRDYNLKNILITGGGALNNYLINLIKEYSRANITIPELKIIDFKEALIFGFLGVLRIQQKNNILSSYTGARKDISSGTIHLPV